MATRDVSLVRRSDGAVVASRLELADGFLSRLQGLMFRRGLAPGAGLWIEPCDSIHMMFVPFPIDVVFVARGEKTALKAGSEGEVVKVCPAVRPWIGLAWCRGASGCVELEAGAAARHSLREGDVLGLVEAGKVGAA